MGIRTIAGVAAAFGLLGATPNIGLADASDYRFETTQPLVKPGQAAPIRLVHVPTGRAVTNLRIIDSKLEMPMQGMAPMGASAKPVGRDSDALRFTVSAPMEGEWLLTITAKVPGETEPIHGVVAIYIETRALPVPKRGPSDDDWPERM